jgi:Flp pilus assembly protein TadD
MSRCNPWRSLVLAVFLSVTLGVAASAQEDSSDYRKGVELLQAQRYEQALPYFQRALTEVEQRYGADDPRVGVEVGNLGEVYRRLGRIDDALPLLLRSVSLAQKQADRDPVGLAAALNNLGLLYRSQGRLTEAEPLYERSLALLQKAGGPDNPDVAQGLNNLAMVYMQEGKPAQAVPLLEHASKIADVALGTTHPTTKAIVANLAKARSEAKRAGYTAGLTPPPPPVVEARPGKSALPPPEMLAEQRAAQVASEPPPARPTLVDPPTSALPQVLPPEPAPGRARSGSPPPAAPAGAAPGYTLHLASMSSMEAAHQAWGRLVKKHPSLAALRQLPPPPIEVPGKGTFYRVIGGTFATRAQAEAACRPVRAAGGECAVIAR